MPSWQFGTSSRTRRRARAQVSTQRLAEARAARAATQRGLEEAQVEAHVVADDHGAADELEERRAAPPRSRGAGSTMASVMPVSTVISGGMADARVDQGLERAEALAAPQLHRPDLGDGARRRATPPVVSRSSDAERDLVRAGVPRSSKVRCTGPHARRTSVRAQSPPEAGFPHVGKSICAACWSVV